MRPDLKLFIWRYKEGYFWGEVYALAMDADHARRVVRMECRKRWNGSPRS